MIVPLRYLDTGEMLAITGAWLHTDRATFESIPEIRPLLGQLTTAHEILTRASPAQSDRPTPPVEALSSQQRQVDLRHDHALRAVYYLHEAMAEYLLAREPADVEGAEAVRAAQAKLLPEGLDGTQATYQSEIGLAARAAQLATSEPGIQQVLERLRLTSEVSGGHVVALWSSLGAELDTLERRKAAADEAAERQTLETAKPRLAHARTGWIRIVSTVLTVLDHVQGSAAAVAQIRRTVTEPATRAARRYALSRKKAADDQPPLPPQPPQTD
jgi:hypothetical protein